MRVRTFELMILLDAEEAEKRDKKGRGGSREVRLRERRTAQDLEEMREKGGPIPL